MTDTVQKSEKPLFHAFVLETVSYIKITLLQENSHDGLSDQDPRTAWSLQATQKLRQKFSM